MSENWGLCDTLQTTDLNKDVVIVLVQDVTKDTHDQKHEDKVPARDTDSCCIVERNR